MISCDRNPLIVYPAIVSPNTCAPKEAVLPDKEKRGVPNLKLHEISSHGHCVVRGTCPCLRLGLHPDTVALSSLLFEGASSLM